MHKQFNSEVPLIITSAITGDHKGKELNPGIPLTCEEQAQQAYDAYNAGASMVHIHRRSAENHAVTSSKSEEYMEVNVAIRHKCPTLIVNNTSGGSKRRLSDGSISAPSTISISARPEVASLDAANLVALDTQTKLRPPVEGRDKEAVLTAIESDRVLAMMKEYSCKPEYMCYGIDDYKYITQFINEGLLDINEPHWIQLLPGGDNAFSKIDDLMTAIRCLPENSILGVISGGETQWEILAAAVALGAHVRVGMEDNMYLSKGELAVSNARLVEKIVRIARELGRSIATPEQAREILGLGAPRQY